MLEQSEAQGSNRKEGNINMNNTCSIISSLLISKIIKTIAECRSRISLDKPRPADLCDSTS